MEPNKAMLNRIDEKVVDFLREEKDVAGVFWFVMQLRRLLSASELEALELLERSLGPDGASTWMAGVMVKSGRYSLNNNGLPEPIIEDPETTLARRIHTRLVSMRTDAQFVELSAKEMERKKTEQAVEYIAAEIKAHIRTTFIESNQREE